MRSRKANFMKVSIIVTDDSGNTFEGEAELRTKRTPTKSERRVGLKRTPHKSLGNPAVNLSSPIRAFMKKHARSLGGPQKFALLLAHMAKGDTKRELAVATVQKQWGKMTGLLAKWNPAYTTRAKEQEWVDSPKTGAYVLLSGWKGIFNA